MATKSKKRVAVKAQRLASVSEVVRPKPLTGAMSAVDMARTLNEWMRRYIEEPEAFQAQFKTINEFLTQEAGGREPDYGEACAAYQFELLAELNSKAA